MEIELANVAEKSGNFHFQQPTSCRGKGGRACQSCRVGGTISEDQVHLFLLSKYFEIIEN